MSRFASCLAAAIAFTSAAQYAPISPAATYTQAPQRYAYGAGAEGRKYFHPMLGRWVLTA